MQMYMNPHTGTVQTLDDWQADYRTDDKELWPLGPPPAGLVEVVPDGDGGWEGRNNGN